MQDDLGNRMKAYENVFRHCLPARLPIILRVDGRAFHTYTRPFKPFDRNLMTVMDLVAGALHEEVQGTIFTYVQSDEISLLIQTDRSLETQQPWGGNIQKLVSTTASLAAAHFNDALKHPKNMLATFDCRAFVMPWDDVPNYFLWRYKDWYRNSVNMQAMRFFNHMALHCVNTAQKLDMLHELGEDWNKLPKRFKQGRFIPGIEELPTYQTIKEKIDEMRGVNNDQ